MALCLLLNALIAGFGDALTLFIVGEVILDEFFEVAVVVKHAFDAVLEEVSYRNKRSLQWPSYQHEQRASNER